MQLLRERSYTSFHPFSTSSRLTAWYFELSSSTYAPSTGMFGVNACDPYRYNMPENIHMCIVDRSQAW